MLGLDTAVCIHIETTIYQLWMMVVSCLKTRGGSEGSQRSLPCRFWKCSTTEFTICDPKLSLDISPEAITYHTCKDNHSIYCTFNTSETQMWLKVKLIDDKSGAPIRDAFRMMAVDASCARLMRPHALFFTRLPLDSIEQ